MNWDGMPPNSPLLNLETSVGVDAAFLLSCFSSHSHQSVHGLKEIFHRFCYEYFRTRTLHANTLLSLQTMCNHATTVLKCGVNSVVEHFPKK